jgi:formate hydrogenlyase subunit 3/multisubunit Na+/H+ antiporter MnhD subunit
MNLHPQELLVAAPALAPLLALAAAALTRSEALRPLWLARAAPVAMSALNLACAAGLLALVLSTGPRTLTFGGWFTSAGTEGAGLEGLAPTLLADASSALLVAALALVGVALTLHATRPDADPEASARAAVALPLVALGAQTACLAGDLGTQLVALELTALGAALFGPSGALRLTRTSLVASVVALLALTAVLSLSGTTRLDALPEALGGLPPQAREVAEAALLAIICVTLHRAAIAPLGGWLTAGTRDPAQALLAPSLAVTGLAALARLHVPLTVGIEAAVARGCARCRDLHLEHLDALLLPLGAVGAVLASLGALQGKTLRELGGWLVSGAMASALVALATPTSPGVAGPSISTTLQLLMVTLAGSAIALALELRGDDTTSGRSPPALMAPFAVASASLLGLPPLLGFVGRALSMRELVGSTEGLLTASALALALVVTTVAVSRAASRHMWREASGDLATSAATASVVAVGLMTASLVALTACAGLVLEGLSAGGAP